MSCIWFSIASKMIIDRWLPTVMFVTSLVHAYEYGSVGRFYYLPTGVPHTIGWS